MEESNCHTIRLILIVVPMIAIAAWGIVTWINTKWGIPGLASYPTVFLFNDKWGNGRGATWGAGATAFGQMNFKEKIFGVGTDCFSAYAYSNPQIAGVLRDYFGSSRLTNAHNELLTELVNVGILGTVLYIGIWASSIRRCLKKAEENGHLSYLMIPAVCIFCYLVHNMVSFAQVLNFPYVFLIAAMGNAEWRPDLKHF